MAEYIYEVHIIYAVPIANGLVRWVAWAARGNCASCGF